MGSISGLNHPTQEADKSLLMKGHASEDVFLIATPTLNGVTGLRIEALNHRDLPHNGPGRSRLGTWAMKELEVVRQEAGRAGVGETEARERNADSPSPSRRADGKNASGPVALLIDGKDNTFWMADRGHGLHNQPSVGGRAVRAAAEYCRRERN